MTWDEIRTNYPDQWLIVEALAAHTTNDRRRVLDRLAVVERCENGADAFVRYRRLHKIGPGRELYFVHTGRVSLEIKEHKWLGARGLYPAVNQG